MDPPPDLAVPPPPLSLAAAHGMVRIFLARHWAAGLRGVLPARPPAPARTRHAGPRAAAGRHPPPSDENQQQHHAPLSGTVLEIGAGDGMWGPTLAALPGVTRVYGVEPNLESAAVLRRRVAEAGVEGKYEVVPTGVEELLRREGGRLEVDCVVSVLCLCSIPDPEANIKVIAGCLARGGRWYVYEHVRVEGCGVGMRLYQREFSGLFLPFFFFLFFVSHGLFAALAREVRTGREAESLTSP